MKEENNPERLAEARALDLVARKLRVAVSELEVSDDELEAA